MPLITHHLPEIKHSASSPEALGALLERQRRRMAEQLGLCRPDCIACQGLGWIRTGNGLVELCPNVDRFSMASAVRLGITCQEADELHLTRLAEDDPVLSASARIIQSTLQRGYGWVYLYGDYGLGKTHLLKAAIAEELRQGHDAAYVRMAEILDDLRSGFDAQAGQPDETSRLRDWSEQKVLAIDEFDRIRNTEYGYERRFLLMDRRYEQACRRKDVTLLASNCPPEELPGYLSDRILDGRFEIIRLKGQSRRPRMEYQP